ncbi:MAG: hypothetical protein MI700_10990 [Balneolales bacterium]|nr:hypothetical protein [Balneolales bacterium]
MKKVACFVTLMLIFIPVRGQESFKFSSTFMALEESDGERLGPILELFNQKMVSKGAEYSENEGLLFLIGASEKDESGNMALSIGAFSKLPETIVQSGKMGQVFYLAAETSPLQMVSEEGTVIREKISEEYIRQFVMIQENKVLMTHSKTLSKDLDNYILEVIERNIIR